MKSNLPSDLLFDKMHQIEFQTKKLAHDLLAGAYHSAFKGRGMEFEEVRPYQVGDDVGMIDWNVTARMRTPYTKVFREEREISVNLVVDISASTHYQNKQEKIAEIGALLAFSAIENHDRVSLILCSDEVELYIPPRSGPRHVLRLIRELLAHKPKRKGTNLAKGLHFLGSLELQQGICFVISDFLDSGYQDPLPLIAKKHDLITLLLVDPLESHPPQVGLLHLQDLETGETILVDTDSKKMQEAIKEQLKNRIEKHRQLLLKVGAEGIEMESDISPFESLHTFFKKRVRQ